MTEYQLKYVSSVSLCWTNVFFLASLFWFQFTLLWWFFYVFDINKFLCERAGYLPNNRTHWGISEKTDWILKSSGCNNNKQTYSIIKMKYIVKWPLRLRVVFNEVWEKNHKPEKKQLNVEIMYVWYWKLFFFKLIYSFIWLYSVFRNARCAFNFFLFFFLICFCGLFTS